MNRCGSALPTEPRRTIVECGKHVLVKLVQVALDGGGDTPSPNKRLGKSAFASACVEQANCTSRLWELVGHEARNRGRGEELPELGFPTFHLTGPFVG